jgi:hypothetical protein
MVTKFFSNASPLVALSAVYRFDEYLSLDSSLTQYTDGFVGVDCKIFNSLKDVSINRGSLLFLTSSFEINEILHDQSETIPFGNLAGFASLKSAEDLFVRVKSDNKLYADGTDIADSSYVQVNFNSDGTCSILYGEKYVTVGLDAPYNLLLEDKKLVDTYAQQKFTYTLHNGTIQLLTYALVNAGIASVPTYISYNSTNYELRCNGVVGSENNNPYTFYLLFDVDNSQDLQTGFNISNYWVRYYNQYGDKAYNTDTTLNYDACTSAIHLNYLVDAPLVNGIVFDDFQKSINTGTLLLNISNLKNVQTPEYDYHDDLADRLPNPVPTLVDQDEVPSTAVVTVSGTCTYSGSALPFVALAGLPTSVTANASGYFATTVPVSWGGTVVPSKPGYTFTPQEYQINNAQSTQSLAFSADQHYRWWGYLVFTWSAAAGVDFNSRTAIVSADPLIDNVYVGVGETVNDQQLRFDHIHDEPVWIETTSGTLSTYFIDFLTETVGSEAVLIDLGAIEQVYVPEPKEIGINIRGNWFGSLSSTSTKVVSAALTIYKGGLIYYTSPTTITASAVSVQQQVQFDQVVDCNFQADVEGINMGTFVWNTSTHQARWETATEFNATSATVVGATEATSQHVVLRFLWEGSTQFYPRCAFTNADETVNNIDVGWSSTELAPVRFTSVPTGNLNPYLVWSANDANDNQEEILVSFSNINNAYPNLSAEDLTVRVRGFWNANPAIPADKEVIVQAFYYNGGTMALSGGSFVNNGGSFIQSKEVRKVVNMTIDKDINGEDVATLTFKNTTDEIDLVVDEELNGDRAVEVGHLWGLVEYNHTTAAGSTFTSRTALSGIDDYLDLVSVGENRVAAHPRSSTALPYLSAPYSLNYITFFDSDAYNASVALIDYTAVTRHYPQADSDTIIVRARGYFGTAGTSAVSINFSLYQGGTMSRSVSTFANAGGELLDTVTFTQLMSTASNGDIVGQNIAHLYLDHLTKEISISAMPWEDPVVYAYETGE